MQGSKPLPRSGPFGGRVHRDLVVGGLLLLFCAAAWIVTLGFDRAPGALAQNVQPATFPRLVILTIAALSLAVIVGALRSAVPKRRAPLGWPVWATAAAMVAFVAAVGVLGMFATIFVFCAVFPTLWGERRYVRQLVIAGAFTGVLYLLFAVMLRVHFEPGIFGI